MFDSHSNTRVHLQRYHLEFVSLKNDDDFFAKLFSLSLKFESFLGFTNLSNEIIIYFDDIIIDFFNRYNLFIT